MLTNLTMHDKQQDDDEKFINKSHGKRLSSVYDTRNLASIMGRFYSAVSWDAS